MNFPTGTAFSATFAYVARHWRDLFRALWLPTALYVAATLYALPKFFTAVLPILDLREDVAPEVALGLFGAILAPFGVLLLASAVLQPMMIVASLKHLVRGEAIKGPFYLNFGADEARVFGAYALLSAMVIVISLVGGLAFGAIAAIVALAVPAMGTLAVSIGDLLVNILTAWFRLRLSVLYPAAIATRTIGFGPAWVETKGRVLGLLGFWILVGLVLVAVSLVFVAPLAAQLWPAFAAVAQAGTDEAAAREALRPAITALAALFRADSPGFLLVAAGLFALTLFTTAFSNVASGVAWRYLGRKVDETAAP